MRDLEKEGWITLKKEEEPQPSEEVAEPSVSEPEPVVEAEPEVEVEPEAELEPEVEAEPQPDLSMLNLKKKKLELLMKGI